MATCDPQTLLTAAACFNCGLTERQLQLVKLQLLCNIQANSGGGSITAGTGLTLTGTVMSLNIATGAALGGVIVSTGLSVDGLGNLTLNKATNAALGGVIASTGLSVDGAGNLTLNQATNAALGGVIVGSNLTVAAGTISLTSGNVTGALGFTPVNKAGDTMTGTLHVPQQGFVAPNQLDLTANANEMWITAGSAVRCYSADFIFQTGGALLVWNSDQIGFLGGGAASGILECYDAFNNTAPAIVRFYGNGAPGANYGRLSITTTSTDNTIACQSAGTGPGNMNLNLTTKGTGVVTITNNGLKHAGTTLIQTSVALTNNAGASAGTLTNAPAVGNPTKWIPINDNGTTRNIPAW